MDEVLLAYQQNEDGGICRQASSVTGDPIKCNGAVVLCTEALTPEFDIRDRTKSRSKDGLHVSIPSDKRVRMIRGVKACECREE